MDKIVDNEQKFFLECSVCMDTYNHLESSRTPKLLLCAHTFCTTCLDGLLMNSSIICPMCRKSTTVPNGVEGLLKNFALIEVLSSGILDQVKQNVCPHCKKNPINIYCPECNAEMCEECSKSVHAFSFLQSHKPAVGTKDELPQKQRCAEHDESLKLFCEDDQVPICMVCNLFGTHKGHNAIFLNDKLKEHQTHLKKQLAGLEKRSNSLRLFSEQLIANGKTLSGNQYAAEQKIKKQFAKLVQILNKRREYLLKQVQQDADWKRSTLLKQRQEAAVEISKFAAVSQETMLIMSGDKTSLMTSVGGQSNKIKKLIDSQAQSANSDIDLNVSIQFDDDVLKSGAVYGLFKQSRRDQIYASPPQLLACEVNDLSVTVKWKPSTKRDKFDQYSIVLRKSDLDSKEDEWIEVKSCKGGNFIETKSGLSPATSYLCKIRGKHKLEWSGFSNVKSFKTAKQPKVSRVVVSVHPRGVQNWKIVATGMYDIEARGAEGGFSRRGEDFVKKGGKGAIMKGRIKIKKGETIGILIGQKGGDGEAHASGGGGGGSFVVDERTGNPLLIAGGGGGGGGFDAGGDGSISERGATVRGLEGGVDGMGGKHRSGSCGAGFIGDSYASAYSKKAFSYQNGGIGAKHKSDSGGVDGGFGGGGAGGTKFGGCGGGGGGFSGGTCIKQGWFITGGGGGGGSYISSGCHKTSKGCGNSGHGEVHIKSVDGLVDLVFSNCGQTGAEGPTQQGCANFYILKDSL